MSAVSRWWIPFVLMAAVLSAYADGLSGPFLYDDKDGIANNESIRSLWPLSGPLMPPRDQAYSGRPIANLSLAMSYALGGTDPFGYRILNLLLHLGSTLLVFGAVRRAFSSQFVPESLHPSATLLSFTTALLWGVHPLVSEVMLFAMQRTEALMGFFYLLTLYAVIRASEERSVVLWSVLAVLVCAAGMGSKASMATAPVLIFFFDRAFISGSFAVSWRNRRFLYMGLASTWAITLGLQRSNPRGLSTELLSLDYLSVQPEVIAHYFRTALWPSQLILDYGPMVPHQAPGFTWGAAVLLIVLAVSVVLVFTNPRVGFVGAWVFGTLAPTSSIVSIFTEIGAERRMYLALIALVALVVVTIHVSLQRVIDDHGRPPPLRRAISVILVSCIAMGFVARTRHRAIEFRDVLSIWQRTAMQVPGNPRALLQTGNELRVRGRVEESIPFYERALAIDSRYMEAKNNLGVALLNLGEVDRAVGTLQEVLAENPSYAYLNYNLAHVLARQGRFSEAVGHYLDELKLQPTLVSSMTEAAWILATHWDPAVRDGSEALRLARRAHQLDPSGVKTLDTRAAAEAEAGNFALAMELVVGARELALLSGDAYPHEDRLAVYEGARPYRSNPDLAWSGPGS